MHKLARQRSIAGILGALDRKLGVEKGPLIHAALTTLAGAGLGWGYGKFIHPLINPDADRDDSAHLGALAGGGLGLLMRAPALYDQYKQHGIFGTDGRSGINSTVLSRMAGAPEAAGKAFAAPPPLPGVIGQALDVPRRMNDAANAYDLYLNGKTSTSSFGGVDHGFAAGHARDDTWADAYLAPEHRRLLVSAMPDVGSVTEADISRRLYAKSPSDYWPATPRGNTVVFDRYTAPQPKARGTVRNVLIGAGLGYAGAGLLGSTLGNIFGMSRTTQRKMRNVGAIAGALYNTGMLT